MVFDFGFERRDVVYPDKIFNEGQFHDVRVRRLNGGATLEIQVPTGEGGGGLTGKGAGFVKLFVCCW